MSTGFTKPLRELVWERADGSCEVCGVSLHHRGGQYHHRRARKMGGSKIPATNEAPNCLLLCSGVVNCHALIESHRTLSTMLGWLVPAGFDPASQPVLRRGDWVFLRADGTVEAA